MARMLCGSSTTQIVRLFRVGPTQYRQGSVSVMLWQVRAGPNLLFRVADRFGQRECFFRRGTQEMERQPLRGFLSDAGQVFQFIDESFNRSGKIRHAPCVAQAHSFVQIYREWTVVCSSRTFWKNWLLLFNCFWLTWYQQRRYKSCVLPSSPHIRSRFSTTSPLPLA